MSLAAIGSYVVTAGILEGTVARLIEWMRGNPTPGNIADTRSLTWDGLFKALRKEAGAESPIGKAIESLLDEHKFFELTDLRHSLVHGAVDVSHPPGITINRRYRDKRGDMFVFASQQVVKESTDHLIALIRELDLLLPREYRRIRVQQPG
jgi:hypothetical protein